MADGTIVLAHQRPEGTFLRVESENGDGFVLTDHLVQPSRILAPLEPVAIFAIGLNYRTHAEETGAKIPQYPIVFMKSPGALQHPGEPIRLPRKLRSEMVDYECELAVVLGWPCRNATVTNALDHVLGYTCANDVSARDWQLRRSGSQWCRAKSFDTFAPLGPCLVTRDEIPDPNALDIRTFLNDEIVQGANTSDMIFSVPQLIEFLSADTTLPAGSVILTGTPSGVGMARDPQLWLKPGDKVVVEIEHIGRLANTVEESTL